MEQTVGNLMTSRFKSNFSGKRMRAVLAIQTLAGKLDTGIRLAERKRTKEIFAGTFDMHFMMADGADSLPVFKIRKNTRKTDHLAGLRRVRMNRNVTRNKAFEVVGGGRRLPDQKKKLEILEE